MGQGPSSSVKLREGPEGGLTICPGGRGEVEGEARDVTRKTAQALAAASLGVAVGRVAESFSRCRGMIYPLSLPCAAFSRVA